MISAKATLAESPQALWDQGCRMPLVSPLASGSRWAADEEPGLGPAKQAEIRRRRPVREHWRPLE